MSDKDKSEEPSKEDVSPASSSKSTEADSPVLSPKYIGDTTLERAQKVLDKHGFVPGEDSTRGLPEDVRQAIKNACRVLNNA